MTDSTPDPTNDSIYRTLASEPDAPVDEEGFDRIVSGEPREAHETYVTPAPQASIPSYDDAQQHDATQGATTTADAAAAGAQQVAGTAADRASDLADSTKEKAADVAATARSEGRKLLSQAQSELRDQAGEQQKRVASGLGSTAQELHRMADESQDGGLAADLVRQVGDRTDRVANWLGTREPGELVSDVRSFAASRPAVFIAGAVVAGVLVGRLARGLKDGDA